MKNVLKPLKQKWEEEVNMSPQLLSESGGSERRVCRHINMSYETFIYKDNKNVTYCNGIPECSPKQVQCP